jgi:hypothetical protein
MKQFNFNRFGKLVRWSLTNDRNYYVRSFLQVLAVLALIYLGFSTGFIGYGGPGSYDGHGRCSFAGYFPCLIITIFMFAFSIIVGPSLMFYSMRGKHERQALLMLPASNLEKYLMRYSTWIILLPIYLVAFFSADLIQYVVNWLLGHDYATFVTGFVFDTTYNWKYLENEQLLGNFVTGLWLHSVFALGATFFRSRKYAGILTVFVLITLGMLWIWLFGGSSKEAGMQSNTMDAVSIIIYAVLSLVNFWLSYKLFCRTQVIGKFVNL